MFFCNKVYIYKDTIKLLNDNLNNALPGQKTIAEFAHL